MIWYALGNPALGGRGVISEAVRQLVQTAFDNLGIEALHAWIMEDNARSRRVLEKNRFRRRVASASTTLHNGCRLDRLYLDLIRTDLDSTHV
jgi:ribosomal-protein-alanine N-acetyltransferase